MERVRGSHHRRALAVALIAAALYLTSCDILARLAEIPEATPESSGTPQRTLPPVADVEPNSLRATLSAEGWRQVDVPSAGISLMLPPGWRTAAVERGHADFGEFRSPRVDPDRLEEARQAVAGSDLILVYAQSGEYAGGADEAVILHFTGWRNADGYSTAYLVRALFADRLEDDQWFEFGSVPIGLGRGQRLQYWWEGATGTMFSTTEIVFRAPNRRPYTLSMLTDAELADQSWEQFEGIMLSLQPM